MNVPENVSSKTIHQVEKQLSKMHVPIELFKQMLEAAKGLDFTAISDPVIKSRYLTSREKISDYFYRVIYQDVYSGSGAYDEFIEFIITLFAIFDSIIQGRLYITDIAMQDSTIVSEFLDSYGFEINRIFENQINVNIAQKVYWHIRKKGTVQLLTVLLNHMGFSHYQINEYELNTIDNKYYLIPNVVYRSDSMKTSSFSEQPVPVENLDDILWTLSEEELNSIYKASIEEERTEDD